MNRILAKTGSAVVTATVAVFMVCLLADLIYISYLVCLILPIGYIMLAVGYWVDFNTINRNLARRRLRIRMLLFIRGMVFCLAAVILR